jgi:hypothetical protein
MTPTRHATAPTLELLRWLSARPRTYRETIEAWRTSCPRLSTWDDAIGDGLVEVARRAGREDALVLVTASGQAVLDDHVARAGTSR